MSNGTYSRLTAIYNEKLFNGIEVSGIYSLGVRDCMGDKTDNCEDVSNENSLAFVEISEFFQLEKQQVLARLCFLTYS